MNHIYAKWRCGDSSFPNNNWGKGVKHPKLPRDVFSMTRQTAYGELIFPLNTLFFLHRPNERRWSKATVASVEPALDGYEQYKIGCNCPYDIRYTYSDELETMGKEQLRTGRA